MADQTMNRGGGPSKWRDQILETSVTLLLPLALLVYIAALILAVYVVRQPFLGVFVEPTLLITDTGEAKWIDPAVGLESYTQITAIDEQRLDRPWMLFETLSRYQAGERVTVTLQPETGPSRKLFVSLQSFPKSALLNYFIIPFVIGGAFLALGWWIYQVRQDQPAVRAFMLFCVAAALSLSTLFDLFTTHRLVVFWACGMSLLGGALIHMALIFPQRSRLDERWPGLRRLVYLPSMLVAVWVMITSYDLDHPWAYISVWRVPYGYIALGLIGLLAMLVRRRLRAQSPTVRQQATVILLGIGLATLPILTWFVLATFQVKMGFEPALLFPSLILIPLSIAYSIRRYRLLDVDWVISYSLSYALLTLVVVGGYFVTINLIGALLGQAIEANNPIVLALFVLVIALSLDPLRQRSQRIIDRFFYRDRLDYRQQLESYSHLLGELLNQPEVLEALAGRILAAMHPTSLSIYLYDNKSNQYAPTLTESNVQPDPPRKVRFLPDGQLARRLIQAHESVYLPPSGGLPPDLKGESAQLDAVGATLYVPIGQHGWVALGPKRSGELYRRDDLTHLEALADQTNIALDRVKLISDLESRLNELDALHWIGQAFNFAVGLDDLLELIYAQTSRILDTTNFYIALHDEEKDTLTFAFYVENDERLYPDDEWALGIGLTSEIIRQGQPIVTDDYTAECLERGITPGGRAGRAWMGVPLRAADRVIGVMNVSSFEPGVVYSPEQVKIFSAIADQAAAMIDRARLYREMEERTRQLTTLNEVGRTITSSLDLQTVLEEIMDKAVEILGTEAGSLILVDLETDELVFQVALGPAAEQLIGMRLPPGTGIVGEVVESQQPTIVRDAQSDERWDSDLDESTDFVTRAILAVPLISKGRCTGVIELINKVDGTTFDEDDQNLLMAFATNAAVAIDNARLFTQTDQALADRVEELSVMQRIDRELNATLDYGQVIDLTLKWAMRITQAQTGLIAQLDEESGDLLLAATRGYPEAFDRTGTLWPIKEGIIGRVVRTGEPAWVNNVAQDPDFVSWDFAARSQLSVPIELGGQPVGVISVESVEADAFSQEDLDFMTRLADHAATAIENARLYEQVKQANEAKSQFVSMVAHELKIPMTSIKGYARLLELGAAGVLDDSQKTFIQTIGSNVERMNRLVSDLLDISRVETGRISLQLEALPIVTVIDETLNSTKGEIENRGLDLTLEVPDNLPLVWGDRTRLVQVLTNLVSNAYKYTPEGSITIKAGVTTTQLNGQEEPREYVSCSVTDTGIGIAPEDQERLFRAQFTRFENAVDVAAGHGLGLWLTNRLVALQDGALFFESELNVGSTFGFLIPVADTQR